MEPQLAPQSISNSKEEEEEVAVVEEYDEEFYEKIEAPKFVDFTVSDDPFRPDDRYWFCLRVGCDRKHEEELDPEEISKNFVLRVMAARSPNIKLRKVLNGRSTSTNMKCPLSAPAKSSRSRMSRLAIVSALSQKMQDVNGKVRTHSKISSIPTPKVKSKQVAAKYMTTPRNKRCIPNQNAFRSVQNPRPSSIAVPKNLLVAKALVFHSPKKAITVKTSAELRTPVTKLCEGMKRLEITSQRKRVLGYSSKSSKGSRCGLKTPIYTDTSREQQNVRNDKSRAKNLLPRNDCKGRDARSTSKAKIKSNQMLSKECDSKAKKTSENDSADMLIDVKPRDGSILDVSCIEGHEHKEHLKTGKISANVDIGDSNEVVVSGDDSDTFISAASGEMNSTNSDIEIDNKSKDCTTLCNERIIEENDHEENLKTEISGNDCFEDSDELANSERVDMNSLPNSQGMNLPASHAFSEEKVEGGDVLKQEENAKCMEDEVMENDDKENVQASDVNRDLVPNKGQPGKKCFNKKFDRKIDKNLNVGVTSVNAGAPDVKYRKPKPTNPKPFRLRTDERGILKEATMERKVHASQKQATIDSRFLGGNSQRRHTNDIKGHEKCSDQSKCSGDHPKRRDKESEKNIQKNCSKTASLQQTIREQACKTPQRRFISSQPEHSKNQKLENSSTRKLQSPSLLRQYVRPQGKLMPSLITPGQQLATIKETSSTRPLKLKSGGQPYESGVTNVTKATASAASMSLSQRRRQRQPLTVPKEPNFHKKTT